MTPNELRRMAHKITTDRRRRMSRYGWPVLAGLAFAYLGVTANTEDAAGAGGDVDAELERLSKTAREIFGALSDAQVKALLFFADPPEGAERSVAPATIKALQTRELLDDDEKPTALGVLVAGLLAEKADE